MSKSEFFFESIQVRRAAAFQPPGFSVTDLVPGINIIYGPNASGKTTLASSLETLLWPQNPALKDAELLGFIRHGEHTWRVEIEDKRVLTQQDGLDSRAGLPLPKETLRDRYFLSLHELLEADNQPFAEVILKESVGGYDIPQAAERLGFRRPNLRTRKSTSALREAEAAWRAAKTRQKALRSDEARQKTLTRELQTLDSLTTKRTLLERAIAYHLVKDDLLAMARRLDNFPQALARFRGDEVEILEKYRQEEAELHDKITRIKELILSGEQELATYPSRLAELPDSFVSTQKNRAETLRLLEESRLNLERALLAATARADELWKLIGRHGAAAPAKPIQSEEIQKISVLADEADQIRAAQKALQALEDLFSSQNEPHEPEFSTRHGEAIQLFRRWLKSPAPIPEYKKRTKSAQTPRFIILASALLIAAASLTLATAIHPLWLILIAITIALGWAFLLLRPPTSPAVENRRELIRKDFEKLQLPGPETWDDQSVENLLRQLEELQAESLLASKKSALLAGKARQKEALNDRETHLTRACALITQELGLLLEPALKKDPAQLFWLIANLQKWQAAQADAAAHQAELEELNAQIDTQKTALAQALEPYQLSPPEDAAQARAQLETLEAKARHLLSIQEKLERANQDLHQAKARASALQQELTAHFRRLDLPNNADHTLKSLATQLQDFQEAQRARNDKKAAMHYAEERLRDCDDFTEDLLHGERLAIEEELLALEKTLEAREDLLKERQDIETRIQAAKTSFEVEEKQALYLKKLEALRRERHKSYEEAVGFELARILREETRDRERPEVFHQANELFSRITGGRYRLVLDDSDPPQFRAFDTLRELGQSLNQLSSGTRLQLLLAVRVAFVEYHEQGAKLPLVLDETLANSDDLRAQAIMEALEHIAAQGRQIFYFTAQNDEVQKWRALAQKSDLTFRFIELKGGIAQNLDPEKIYGKESLLPAPVQVPPPQNLSHADYGELLGLPQGIDPFAPAGATHLWFLIEETDLLYSLLARGISSWGQLQSLCATGGPELLGLTPFQFARIKATQRALEAFKKAWKIGRGKPVTRATLQASGAVSDTFLDRVHTLADQLQGDASQLLAALEQGQVSGFYSSKRQELAEFLEAKGYLDPRQPLPTQDLWLHTLASIPREYKDGIITDAALRRLINRATGQHFPANSHTEP